MRNSTCYFLLIQTWTFQIDLIEGLTWITKPPPINKCIGHDVTLMWTFEKEANEEIRQLQWLVNSTKLIAYKSVRNGFYIYPEYQGRVEISNETGISNKTQILLKNISTKDTGNYTLYPIVAQEESPNIQSVWLNVIDTTTPKWCTCERLPLLPEWSSGQIFSIVAEGCHLEINSSFCCPKGPAIEYCENDQQKLCVSIRNPINITESTTQSSLTESTTRSRIVPEQTDDKKDPTVLQKGNTQADYAFLYVLAANTAITFLLVICCFVHVRVLWMKLDRDNHSRKNPEESNSSFL